MCARKGFDAVELDDIDGFDPPSTTGFHLTPGDAQNFLAYAFNEIHRLGMTGLWKNSPYLSWWGRDYADGAIVEECYLYQQCTAASLRGSSQYGITCTALTGATPCGWDDFSTDRTGEQPDRQVGRRGGVLRGQVRVQPGSELSGQAQVCHLLPRRLLAHLGVRRGQVRRRPRRQAVLPLPGRSLTARTAVGAWLARQ